MRATFCRFLFLFAIWLAIFAVVTTAPTEIAASGIKPATVYSASQEKRELKPALKTGVGEGPPAGYNRKTVAFLSDVAISIYGRDNPDSSEKYVPYVIPLKEKDAGENSDTSDSSKEYVPIVIPPKEEDAEEKSDTSGSSEEYVPIVIPPKEEDAEEKSDSSDSSEEHVPNVIPPKVEDAEEKSDSSDSSEEHVPNVIPPRVEDVEEKVNKPNNVQEDSARPQLAEDPGNRHAEREPEPHYISYIRNLLKSLQKILGTVWNKTPWFY